MAKVAEEQQALPMQRLHGSNSSVCLQEFLWSQTLEYDKYSIIHAYNVRSVRNYLTLGELLREGPDDRSSQICEFHIFLYVQKVEKGLYQNQIIL